MSAPGLARRTAVEIAFAGEDITASIRPYLLSVTYTDNEEEKTDDLQIKLEDRDSMFYGKHGWTITSFSLKEQAFSPGGNVSAATVSVTLQEYMGW